MRRGDEKGGAEDEEGVGDGARQRAACDVSHLQQGSRLAIGVLLGGSRPTLPVLELCLADGGPCAAEEVHLAADVLHHLHGRAKSRPERDLNTLGAGEHGGELLQQAAQLLLLLLQRMAAGRG